MNYPEIISRLADRLQAKLPGLAAQELMTGRVLPLPNDIPDNARQSAVLGTIFPIEDKLHLLFIRRTEDGKAHGGQISFPGGRKEDYDENLEATALRETMEEVGISAHDLEIVGALSSLYIPVSRFIVYPFIAYTPVKPQYNPSIHEVAEILELPINHLFDKKNRIITDVRPSSMPSLKLTVPAYSLPDGTFIWGATAMILSELEVIWNEL